MIHAAALAITLGVIMGLPVIYRNNGPGLLVVLVASIFVAIAILVAAKREHQACTADLPNAKLRVRISPFRSLVCCVIGGSSIAVIGGS